MRVFGIALLFVVGVALVMAAAQSLVLIFVAFFLALALNPPVSYLKEKLPLDSRGLATAVVFIIAFSVVGVLISTLLPPIIRQTDTLITQVPVYVEDLSEHEMFATLAERFELEERGEQIREGVIDRAGGVGEPVLAFITRITTNIVSLLTILVLTFFMLVEGPKWMKRFWEVNSDHHEEHRKQIAYRMYRVITGYVNGQLLIAAINAFATAIVLLILGIPYALSLAAIVGILGLIPIIGASIGAVVVIIAGLVQGVPEAVILAIYYIVYQQVENNFIQPTVQSKSLGMSPLLILVSVVIGINLAGILGGLIAIPIAGCLRVLVLDYLDSHDVKHA